MIAWPRSSLPRTAAVAALVMASVMAWDLASPLVARGRDAASPGAGLIHATVTLRDGTTHNGFLRWKDEDACWDDVFSARQRDLPWFAFADRAALARERRNRYFATHGLVDRLAWSLHNRDDDVHISRPFVCRYGDLAALRLTEDGDRPVLAVMRDGREVPIGGPSSDIGSDLVIQAAPDRSVELAWDDVREIRFAAAPATAAPNTGRLAGTVEFRGGRLSGTLQWDRSECLGVDTLDSDQQDVPMAQLRRLARSRRGGSEVTLTDGRVLQLDGTNDVDEGNRGVAVEVAGLGRVTVPWRRFIAADLRVDPATAPGYDTFGPPGELTGTVTTTDGRTLTGRLVYDLDEAWTTDLFHGELDECGYQVPFGRIAAVKPAGPGSCEVTLRDGRRLSLAGDEDTGDGHAGLLVFVPGRERPEYVPWSAVGRLEFAP